ncbi:MAG: bifunctional diaminohydroxyphosphoribosylaminopyrimidine deaminase/5-amino-6-(5-phosphoribosylamino)uracil reductase RibD [Ruminococcus sp.]|nr:bifunctional diaminohydroxyphosphoribosylaminopyrimidine deaminase/5-amino-6-(5-phosphoribosylamino)uracil reductase RibD [Ruminococcus sp.]
MNHEEFMKTALVLAENGTGYVNPNPLVGAVIVRDGRIIGKGWHKKYGELHAERNAFADCSENCEGADLYVTLEPCCHHGKTPPCTDIIIEKKIRRVFIGSADPNPLVSGKGAEILRQHGIEVHEGILSEQCDRLNEIFFHFITTGTPFVTMKYAMTMDGKIACHTGLSKWITGEESRKNVHLDRLRHSAVMVGVGTVIADNPMLTCRLENGRNPIRIVCDTNLNTPLGCDIVKTANQVPTVIATSSDDSAKAEEYEKCGCRIMKISRKNGHIDLCELMRTLGSEKTDSVFLEGGGELNYSALKSGIVNKVQAYIAPKIFGGLGAKTAVSGDGVNSPELAYMLENAEIKRFGDDIMIESLVRKCSRE